MISSRPYFHTLNITLEAQSAHAIHTGFGDTTHDSLVVRDANGLPTLPATSIAGVLRSAYQKQFGMHSTQQLFGYAHGHDGQSSWLTVSWGLVHNSQNIAQEGLLSAEALSDPLLTGLLNIKPIVRQRVQLNDQGAAHDTGKFDTTLVPAGTRYSTLIHYWCDGSEVSKQLWQDFLKLLHMPLRFGQGTRNGYGLFSIQAIHVAQWDLTQPEDIQAYRNRSRKRRDLRGLKPMTLLDNRSAVQAVMSLQAESFWRVGGGERYLATQHKERAPDLLPMHEPRITWSNGQGQFTSQFYLLPATAIKGALRHRIAFHYNCLSGCFAEDGNGTSSGENPAVRALFGFASDKSIEGRAGIIALKDIYLVPKDEKTLEIMHNRIDRYTAGVIRGALFNEDDLYQSRIEISFDVLTPEQPLEPGIRKALALTLEDLAQGWLPLGASGSRGLGVFVDSEGNGVNWSDNAQWIAGAST